jgi:transcription termination factor Rho
MSDEIVLDLPEATPATPPDSANGPASDLPQRMSLMELKEKSPADLVTLAETLEIENANAMRKQDMMFAILKTLADEGVEISGGGVLEVLSDGFGFLRSPEANYLPGPDDIYVSPSQIRRFGLRTGDSVEGPVRSPREGERYFALLKVDSINFENPENVRHKVAFDNLTPLYPEQRLTMEMDDPTLKDRSGPCDRHRRAAGQGSALLDRRAASGRQDGHAAEHRQERFGQSPGMLSDRPADRRAARRGHRHAATVNGEVISSTFDEPATRHVQVAEMVIERPSAWSSTSATS